MIALAAKVPCRGKALCRPLMGARSLLSLSAFAFFLSGCGGGGESPPLEEQSPAAICSGANSSGARQAVYVAAQGADGSGCGTTTAIACKTLQQGIDNCSAPGCAVFVRHGLYPTSATIRLREGVSVYGGCRFDGEPDRRYRTVVDAKPAAGTPAVSADSVNSPTAFDRIVVMGKDETANGTASIAMAVSNSKGLSLTRSVLVAGSGGDGGPVSPATAATAQNGGAGDTNSFTAGGQGPGGPSCDPGGAAGRGGDGSARRQNTVSSCGLFSCDCNESGGLKGSNGGATGSIPGGPGGGSGTQGNACWEGVIRQGDGGHGAIGGPGAAGNCSLQSGVASADVWGSFQRTSWLPGTGGAGGSGDVGSGGGGGPGGMCTLQTSDTRDWFPYWGRPGGGGGAGGCPGPGGVGGQQGGPSIGLMLLSSSIALDAGSVAIVGGQGGSGGQGATGGIGGAGGAGGAGGNSGSNCKEYVYPLNLGWGGLGGHGGSGGQGGAGGGGAGGNGGPSVGVALFVGSPAPADANVYPGFSAAGAGGGAGSLGGAKDCAGATGQHGVPGGVAVVFDAAHPPRNVMTPGQTLHANESLTSPDGRYLLTMQADNNLVLYAVSRGVRSYVWDTATEASQQRPGVATMQTDGNFVVYDATGQYLFPSSTDGHPGASLRVQDDGHVQVVNVDGSLLWYAPCNEPRGGIACSPSRRN